MSTHVPTVVPAARPESDVSSAVGLSGLFGLFLWVAICRNWPDISAWLGYPGQGRMSGPYAALACVAVSGLQAGVAIGFEGTITPAGVADEDELTVTGVATDAVESGVASNVLTLEFDLHEPGAPAGLHGVPA